MTMLLTPITAPQFKDHAGRLIHADERGPFKIITIQSWMDAVYGPDWAARPVYDAVSDDLAVWCVANHATYYTRPCVSFDVGDAVHECQAMGVTVVVVEDLS